MLFSRENFTLDTDNGLHTRHSDSSDSVNYHSLDLHSDSCVSEATLEGSKTPRALHRLRQRQATRGCDHVSLL